MQRTIRQAQHHGRVLTDGAGRVLTDGSKTVGSLVRSYVGTDDGTEEWRDGVRISTWDFLATEIVIDDDNVEVVLVFPKLEEDNGNSIEEWSASRLSGDAVMKAEDEEKGGSSSCSSSSSSSDEGHFVRPLCGRCCPAQGPQVEDPYENAQKLFQNQWNEEAQSACNRLRGHKHVSERVFQREVQDHLLKKLRQIGLKMESFSSIDNDEDFWKISADNHVLRRLAAHYGYHLPVKEQVYKDAGVELPAVSDQWLGGSEAGIAVYMHAQYTQEDADHFQDFSTRDRVRLVFDAIREVVQLSELRKQKVISCFVLVPKYSEMREVKTAVAIWKWPIWPTKKEIQAVRNVFGEQIAFHFNFMGINTQCLMALSCFALPAWLYSFLPIHPYSIDFVQMIIGLLVIVTIETLRNLNKRETAVLQRIWGMNANSAILREPLVELSETESCIRVARPETVGIAVTLLYLCLVLVVFALISVFLDSNTMATSLASVMLGTLWQKVALQLVLWERHKMQRSFTKSLVSKVPYVKIFCYLFPICRTALFQGFINASCATTVDEALWNLFDQEPPFQGAAFDKNLFYRTFRYNDTEIDETVWNSWLRRARADTSCYNSFIFGAFHATKNFSNYLEGALNASMQSLDQLRRHNYTFPMQPSITPSMHMLGTLHTPAEPAGQVCIVADKPLNCVLVQGTPACRGVIYKTIETSVPQLFYTHVLFNILFLLWPTFHLRYVAKKEIAERQDHNAMYTWLQFWRKSFDVAPYGYQQWGGSHVEDFMETITCLAVAMCFAVLMPKLILLALGVQIIEYKLLSIRFTQVTCPPFPLYADGIGDWDEVVAFLSLLGLLVNGMLLFNFSRWQLATGDVDDKLLVCLAGVVLLLLMRRGSALVFGADSLRLRRLCLTESVLTKRRRPLPFERQNEPDAEEEFVGVCLRVAQTGVDDTELSRLRADADGDDDIDESRL